MHASLMSEEILTMIINTSESSVLVEEAMIEMEKRGKNEEAIAPYAYNDDWHPINSYSPGTIIMDTRGTTYLVSPYYLAHYIGLVNTSGELKFFDQDVPMKYYEGGDTPRPVNPFTGRSPVEVQLKSH
jgi:hypothetical protein